MSGKVKSGFFDGFLDSFGGYKTFKVVEVGDKRLGLMYRILIFGVCIYVGVMVIIDHSYLYKEKPTLLMNAYATMGNYDAVNAQTNFTTGRNRPDYCKSLNSDYVYNTDFKYKDIRCITGLTLEQLSRKEAKGVMFMTSIQQTLYSRTCNSIPSNPKNEFAVECTTTEVGQANAFTAGIEEMILHFAPAYFTTWGTYGKYDDFSMKNKGKKKVNGKNGEELSIRLADVLDMAGVDLDERNKDSGGSGPGKDGNKHWPYYRLTGLAIDITLDFANFRTRDPFDFSVSVDAKPMFSSGGSWVGPGGEVMYTGGGGATQNSMDKTFTVRYYQGVRVEFVETGMLGEFNFYVFMMSLVHGAVLIGIAANFVDIAGAFVLDSFKDKKYEDQDENMQVEKMLAYVDKTGLPFDPTLLLEKHLVVSGNMTYEEAIESLQRNQDDLKSRFDSWQEQAAKKFNVTLHDKPIAHFADLVMPRLLCPNGTVVSLMFGEKVVLGRGIGGMLTDRKDISRRLLSVRLTEDMAGCEVKTENAVGKTKMPGIGRVDPETGKLEWTKMGVQPETLLHKDQICLYLPDHGEEPPVGVFTFETPHSRQVDVGAEIEKAFNPEGKNINEEIEKAFSRERLEEVFDQTRIYEAFQPPPPQDGKEIRRNIAKGLGLLDDTDDEGEKKKKHKKKKPAEG